MRVAPSALSAAADDKRFTVGHVVYNLARSRIAYKCSGRNGQLKVGRVSAVEFFGLAVSAVLRDELMAITVGKQCVGIFIDDQHDIAAFASVSAGRSAMRYIFFSVERNTAVAAVTGF